MCVCVCACVCALNLVKNPSRYNLQYAIYCIIHFFKFNKKLNYTRWSSFINCKCVSVFGLLFVPHSVY